MGRERASAGRPQWLRPACACRRSRASRPRPPTSTPKRRGSRRGCARPHRAACPRHRASRRRGRPGRSARSAGRRAGWSQVRGGERRTLGSSRLVEHLPPGVTVVREDAAVVPLHLEQEADFEQEREEAAEWGVRLRSLGVPARARCYGSVGSDSHWRGLARQTRVRSAAVRCAEQLRHGER